MDCEKVVVEWTFNLLETKFKKKSKLEKILPQLERAS